MVSKVIVVRPEEPENTGLIARSCANYNVDLTLVNPDFKLSEARKTAGSYQEKINDAEVFSDLEEAIEKEDYVVGSAMRSENNVSELKFPENSALLIGPESQGLSNEDLEVCDISVSIKTFGKPSLNQANATAVLLDRLSKSKTTHEFPEERVEALESKTGSKTLSNVVARSSPSEEELDKILGELKQ